MRPVLRPRKLAAAAGFTLAELLVAMTLLGLISVALFGGLRFGARAWEVGMERADNQSQVEAVQNVLRRQLQRAVSFPLPDEATSFYGERDRLQFSAPAASQFGPSGFYRFELLTVSDQGRDDLILRWRVERSDLDESGIEPDERVLLLDVADLEFDYYGDPRRSFDAEWQEEWQDLELPPDLIAVRIAFPEDDERVWPELIVAPRLSHNPVF